MKRIKGNTWGTWGTAFLILLFLGSFFSTAVFAEEKRINVIGTIGLASSLLDDPILELGAELELFRGVYGRVAFMTTFGGTSIPSGPYSDGSANTYFSPDFGIYGNTMFGINAAVVYKLSISKRANLVGSAGAFFMRHNEYYYEMEEDTLFKRSTNNTGALAGAGFEYTLFYTVDLVLGGVYHWFITDRVLNPETGNIRRGWLKISLGLNLRIKG
jgi:hypothetical protein